MTERPSHKLMELKLEVTYDCPLACIHCSSNAYSGNALHMGSEECLRILREASDMGVRAVAFSGGEPLVWPHIAKCVELAGSAFDEVVIYTTGNVDDFKSIATELKRVGLTRMVFSLYAATDAKHDWVTRVAGSFNKTIDALRDAHSLGLETEIHFVVTAYNYSELRAVCELGTSLGVSAVSVLRLVPQGRAAMLDGALSKEQILGVVTAIKQLRKEGFALRTGSPMNVFWVNEKPECKAALDRLIVSPDLNVSPCDAFKQVDASDIAGTTADSNLATKTLEECWTGSPYLNRVRSVLSSPPEGPCATCGSVTRCETGCLAQKYIVDGVLARTRILIA